MTDQELVLATLHKAQLVVSDYFEAGQHNMRKFVLSQPYAAMAYDQNYKCCSTGWQLILIPIFSWEATVRCSLAPIPCPKTPG
jgi:hypothetical protein